MLAEASPWGSFRHAGYYLPRYRVYGIGNDRFGHFGWLYESYGGRDRLLAGGAGAPRDAAPDTARYAIVLDPKIVKRWSRRFRRSRSWRPGYRSIWVVDLAGRGDADLRVRPHFLHGPTWSRGGHLWTIRDLRVDSGRCRALGPVECDRDRWIVALPRSARPSPTTLASIWRTSTALAPARTASDCATRPGRARRRLGADPCRGRSRPTMLTRPVRRRVYGVADPPLIWRRAPRPRRAPRRLPDLPLDPEAVKLCRPRAAPAGRGGPAPGLRDARRRGRLGAARSVGGAARRRVRCHRPVRPHGRPLPGSRASDGPSTRGAGGQPRPSPDPRGRASPPGGAASASAMRPASTSSSSRLSDAIIRASSCRHEGPAPRSAPSRSVILSKRSAAKDLAG